MPPEALALHVAELPTVAEVGDTEQETATGALLIDTLFEQVTEVVCDPEVTLTEPVLVPVDEYDFETELPVPERLSLPLQEYV